jgi:hypothetical protein
MGLSGVYLICAGLYALGSMVTLGFVQARGYYSATVIPSDRKERSD